MDLVMNRVPTSLDNLEPSVLGVRNMTSSLNLLVALHVFGGKSVQQIPQIPHKTWSQESSMTQMRVIQQGSIAIDSIITTARRLRDFDDYSQSDNGVGYFE